MIRIDVNKDLITVSGHAGAGIVGQDIVCASASSIIYTTINGILNIDNKAIEYTDDNKLLKIKIIDNNKVVNTLINNMIMLLEDLENQYPENLKVRKGD